MDSGPWPSLMSHTWWHETWGPIQENAFYVNILCDAPPAGTKWLALGELKTAHLQFSPPYIITWSVPVRLQTRWPTCSGGGPVYCTMASITLASTNYTAVPAPSMWQSKLSKCRLEVNRPPTLHTHPPMLREKKRLITHISTPSPSYSSR